VRAGQEINQNAGNYMGMWYDCSDGKSLLFPDEGYVKAIGALMSANTFQHHSCTYW